MPLMETRSLSTPALFGVIHPRLMLPAGLTTQLTNDELHYVFMHELAHFKRKRSLDIRGIGYLADPALVQSGALVQLLPDATGL